MVLPKQLSSDGGPTKRRCICSRHLLTRPVQVVSPPTLNKLLQRLCLPLPTVVLEVSPGRKQLHPGDRSASAPHRRLHAAAFVPSAFSFRLRPATAHTPQCQLPVSATARVHDRHCPGMSHLPSLLPLDLSMAKVESERPSLSSAAPSKGTSWLPCRIADTLHGSLSC